MVLTMNRLHGALIALLLSSTAVAQRSPNTSPLRARPLLFGFALECTDCEPGMGPRGRSGGGGRGPTTVWTYSTYPRVLAVAPGSAAEHAGIRPGDVLHEIDGMSVLTNEAAVRFAAAADGEKITLGFERNGKPMSFPLVLGAPTFPSTSVKQIIGGYGAAHTGQFQGSVDMEFWSDVPISVVADSATRSVTFQIGTSTIIRLKVDTVATNPANRPSTKKDGSQWY